MSTNPDPPITEAEARRRKELALARKHEIDLAERQASLVPAALVKQRWASIATSVRNAVLAIPDRLAPLVAPCTTAIEARDVLVDECEQVLRLLAAEIRDGGHGSAAHGHHAAPATNSATSDEAEKQEAPTKAAPRRTHGKPRSKQQPKTTKPAASPVQGKAAPTTRKRKPKRPNP